MPSDSRASTDADSSVTKERTTRMDTPAERGRGASTHASRLSRRLGAALLLLVAGAAPAAAGAQRWAPAGVVLADAGPRPHLPLANPAPPALVQTPAPRPPRYAAFAGWGAGIGAALGLTAGYVVYRRHPETCEYCLPSKLAMPAGAVLGAATGFVTGSFLYLLARSAPPPPP